MADTIEHGSPKRIHCGRCRMSFRVELPKNGVNHPKGASWTCCAEPGCGRRFWHGTPDNKRGIVVCGVDPNETEHRCPGGERAYHGAPAPVRGAVDLPELTPAPEASLSGANQATLGASLRGANWEPAAFCRGGE
jgi:hypothetical protein